MNPITNKYINRQSRSILTRGAPQHRTHRDPPLSRQVLAAWDHTLRTGCRVYRKTGWLHAKVRERAKGERARDA